MMEVFLFLPLVFLLMTMWIPRPSVRFDSIGLSLVKELAALGENLLWVSIWGVWAI
jgi:hypothetical protein